ncbi:MAG: hypothetical protein JRI50_11630 [Deltaproteobacteria bacterium]|nr:hypothetical protein [Deltaproteobacteria bacterium]
MNQYRNLWLEVRDTVLAEIGADAMQCKPIAEKLVSHFGAVEAKIKTWLRWENEKTVL